MSAIYQVQVEVERSKRAHPHVSDDVLRASCVVVEEAGEVMQAALNMTRYGNPSLGYLEHLITEVEQCAAACHRLLDERLYLLLAKGQ